MKDYSGAIEFMKSEMLKQTEPFHKFYLAAIEAMESKSPTQAEYTKDYVICPGCDKVLTHRYPGEKRKGTRICNACGQHMVWGEADDNREKM